MLAPSTDFSQLWTRILNSLDQYMHLGELLAEAIPESLKNMLLVMTTSGVFRQMDDSDPLWTQTWQRIHQFLPGLQYSLFPETAPAQVQPPAASQSSPSSHFDVHAQPPVTLVAAPSPPPSEFTLGPPIDFQGSGQDTPEGVELHPHPIIV